MAGITITGILMILILCAFLAYGVRMGFVKAVFDLFSFLFTGLLTWLLYPWVSGIFLKTPLYDFIKSFLESTLKGNEILEKSLAEFFLETPVFIKDSIIESSRQAFSSLVENTVDALSVLFVNIISIILLFIVVRLLSAIIKKYAVKINKIILIGTINKILGGIFGLVQGYFLICLIIYIISLFPAGNIYNRVKEDFEVSYTAGVLFNEDADVLGVRARFSEKKGE